MKHTLILLALATSFMAYAAHASPPERVTTWPVEPDLRAWIKRGTLVYKSSENTDFLRSYVYKTSSGEWIPLFSNIGGINVLLKDEIRTNDLAIRFVNEQLSQFLFSMLASYDDEIIDKNSLTRGVDPTPKSGALPGIKPLSKTKAAQLTRKLGHYVTNPAPLVNNNRWQTHFNIRSRLGGVEGWTVKGIVAPLQIVTVEREILEPYGTFPKIVTTD